MKKAAWRWRGAESLSERVWEGYGTTIQVGKIANTYPAAANNQARRMEISPVTSGLPGLFVRSISRSAIWLTMLEAAFMADAQREPMATVKTTAHVTRRPGSGLWAEPK